MFGELVVISSGRGGGACGSVDHGDFNQISSLERSNQDAGVHR